MGVPDAPYVLSPRDAQGISRLYKGSAGVGYSGRPGLSVEEIAARKNLPLEVVAGYIESRYGGGADKRKPRATQEVPSAPVPAASSSPLSHSSAAPTDTAAAVRGKSMPPRHKGGLERIVSVRRPDHRDDGADYEPPQGDAPGLSRSALAEVKSRITGLYFGPKQVRDAEKLQKLLDEEFGSVPRGVIDEYLGALGNTLKDENRAFGDPAAFDVPPPVRIVKAYRAEESPLLATKWDKKLKLPEEYRAELHRQFGDRVYDMLLSGLSPDEAQRANAVWRNVFRGVATISYRDMRGMYETLGVRAEEVPGPVRWIMTEPLPK